MSAVIVMADNGADRLQVAFGIAARLSTDSWWLSAKNESVGCGRNTAFLAAARRSVGSASTAKARSDAATFKARSKALTILDALQCLQQTHWPIYLEGDPNMEFMWAAKVINFLREVHAEVMLVAGRGAKPRADRQRGR
jgi:hypothetical protein